MKKSKLLTLLSAFSDEELKHFEKFIESPYFNSGRNFKPLLDSLKLFHPVFDNSDLTEENIFKKLYPGKTYDKKSAVSLRVLESQMLTIAVNFLQIEELGNYSGYKYSLLLRNFNKKGRHELVNEYGKKFLKEFENEKFGTDHYISQFLLRREIGKYLFETKNSNADFLTENIIKNIDCAILVFINRLIWFYEQVEVYPSKNLPESELLSIFEKYFDVNKFIESLKNTHSFDSEYLLMLCYSFKIVTDLKDHKSFTELSKLFFKNIYKLTYNVEFEFAIKLMNFCMFQRIGNKEFYDNEYLKIYYLLIKDVPKEKYSDVFNLRAVRNFIRMMIYFKRFDELEIYINLYSQYFDEDIRSDSINYVGTSLAFAKTNYEKCLEIISKHTFNVPMIIKDLKIMKLQSCYELCYFDILHLEIDSFRHFLSSTLGIPKDFIENDKRFLVYFKQLSRIKENSDNDGIHLLKKELKELNSANIHINWIILKLEELTT